MPGVRCIKRGTEYLYLLESWSCIDGCRQKKNKFFLKESKQILNLFLTDDDRESFGNESPQYEESHRERGKERKRGTFPKLATNILKSWLFQHLSVSWSKSLLEKSKQVQNTFEFKVSCMYSVVKLINDNFEEGDYNMI